MNLPPYPPLPEDPDQISPDVLRTLAPDVFDAVNEKRSLLRMIQEIQRGDFALPPGMTAEELLSDLQTRYRQKVLSWITKEEDQRVRASIAAIRDPKKRQIEELRWFATLKGRPFDPKRLKELGLLK